MATDQFGNILSPEEEERLRQHQIQMGIMPTALPPSAPFGGGIGLSNYQGMSGPYEAPPAFVPEPIVPNEPFSVEQLANITPTWDTDATSGVPQVGDWTQGGVHHAGGYELGPAVDSRFMNNEGVLTGGVASSGATDATPYSNPEALIGTGTTLGGLAAIEAAKRSAEKSGLINPRHGSLMSKAAFEAANPGKVGTSMLRAALTPGTLPANIFGVGLPMMMYSSDANAPTTGATQEEMLALQQSLQQSSSGVSPQTDQDYLDLGVTPPGSEIAHPAQSPLLDQRYLEQLDKQTVTDPTLGHLGYTDPLSAIEDANVSASNVTQGPGMATSWGDKLSTFEDAWGKINQMGNAGMLSAPTDFSAPFMDMWGHPTMTDQDASYSQGLKQQLAADLFGPLGGPLYAAYQVPDEGFKAAKDILSGKINTPQQENAGLGGFLAQMAPALGVEDGTALATINDAWAAANVDDFSFLANPNITAMNTLSEDFDELAFGAYGTKHVPGTSLPVTPPDSMLMQDFIDKYGPVRSGTRDAYYHRDGTVRNAAGDIVATDAAYDEASGMGQVASHPGQGGHIGGPTDPDITIPEMLARQDARTAAAVMAPRQQAMPEVSIPDALARQDVRTAMAAMAPRQDAMPAAPAGPTPAQIAAQVAAAEQAHRDQQASAQRALRAFYNSRDYQEGGASAPAGLIEIATEVDTFGSGNPFSEQYQGGYVDMGGFESREGGMGGGGGRDHGGGHHGR